MPGLDPVSLGITAGLGLIQGIPKIAAAIKQKKLANNLRVQNTQPIAFQEQMAGLRLGANTARLPGMGAAEDKLGQNFAAGAGAATRSGASSADMLAGINALSLNRQAGQNQLNTQGLQYQDAAKQRLNVGLTQQAAYQKNDLDNFSRTKSNLIQSSNENLNNAIGGFAGFAALGLNGATGGTPAGPVGEVAPLMGSKSVIQGLNLPQLPGQLPYYNPAPASGVGLTSYGRVRRKQQGVGLTN
jgi:hypothetical protein